MNPFYFVFLNNIYYQTNEAAANAVSDLFEVYCQRIFIVASRTITDSTDNIKCDQSEDVETELE